MSSKNWTSNKKKKRQANFRLSHVSDRSDWSSLDQEVIEAIQKLKQETRTQVESRIGVPLGAQLDQAIDSAISEMAESMLTGREPSNNLSGEQ